MSNLSFLWVIMAVIFIHGSTEKFADEMNRFDKVQNLRYKFYPSNNKIQIQCKKVTDAQKYVYRIRDVQGQIIKKVKKTKNKKRFKISLFAEGQTYTLEMKIASTDQKKSSKWRKISYVHTTQSDQNSIQGTLTSQNSSGRSGSYFFPDSYDIGYRPILVAFHGTGGSGEDMINSFKDMAQEYGFMIVAPDSRKAPGGSYTWEVGTSPGEITEDLTHALNCVNEALSLSGMKYDSNHVLCVGFSGGASSAPYLATNDTMFTHFAVLHGGVFVTGLGENVVSGWLSTGDDDLVRTPSHVQSYISQLNSSGFDDITFQSFAGGHTIISEEKESLMQWWL